tara:strand:- start:335 stop:667 length:333 start_codon:yes stop_codon:yes gene_type:complete
MSGKYLYFNEGGGADLSTEAVCIPAESLRGMDPGSDVLTIYYDPISTDAATVTTDGKSVLVVADGSQIEVAIAIAEAIATMNAGILTIYDGDNGLALHSAITGVANTLTE